MKNHKIGIVLGTGYAGMLSERLAKMHDIPVVSPDVEQKGNLYDLKTTESITITRMAEEFSEAIKRGDFPKESKHKCTRKMKPRKKNKKTHLKKRK